MSGTAMRLCSAPGRGVERDAMRGLQAAVVFMGVVIVAMVATIVLTLAHRMSAPAPSAVASTVLLDQPAGTRIQAITALGGRLAILLQGGGPDRIIFVDPAHGPTLGSIALRR
jgi:hypothetical protein